MIRWIGRAVTIFALCCAIGLQWLALQSIAWTAMIVDYSKQGSICRAIAKTLDGAHPCSLCHVVNSANTAEKKADLQLLTPKIDMICASRAISLSFRSNTRHAIFLSIQSGDPRLSLHRARSPVSSRLVWLRRACARGVAWRRHNAGTAARGS